MENEDLNKFLLNYFLSTEKEKVEHKEKTQRIEDQKPLDSEEFKSLFKKFQEVNEFQVGDLVEWKDPLLKNKHYPLLKQQAIVVEILNKPVIDQEIDSSSPAFGTKYDIILGVVIDEVFYTFYFESRRFKKIDN